MEQAFRYHRPGIPLEFYTEIYDYSEQHLAAQASTLPKNEQEFYLIGAQDPVPLDAGIVDIRHYSVNTPNGNTLGMIESFLADRGNLVIPYSYIRLANNRLVVVPTNQFMIYPENSIVTLEGGVDALHHAPDAKLDASDARRADHYWGEFRRRNAA